MKTGKAEQRPAWVILADGDVDQICYSEREARREKRDLEAMGYAVKIKAFATVAEAEQFEDKRRGY
jgi:hypothetical protein